MKKILFLAVLGAAALAAGCASTARPVLYPNSHLKQVGDAQAQHDIEECRVLAENAGAEAHDAGRAVRPAAEGTAVGAASSWFLSALGGGVTTTPMAQMPLVLIPTFFVPIFVMLHLTAFFQAAMMPSARRAERGAVYS